MSEQTVRCHQCGKRIPESQAIRREVPTHEVAGVTVSGLADVCSACDHAMARKLTIMFFTFLAAIAFIAIWVALR